MGSVHAGLDFAFLYVKDLTEKDALNSIVNSDENMPKINIWILESVEKVDLLKLVLKPEDLMYTSALVMLDFAQPWEIMNALERWVGALNDSVLDIMKGMPASMQDQMKNKITRYVKNYNYMEEAEDVKDK